MGGWLKARDHGIVLSLDHLNRPPFFEMIFIYLGLFLTAGSILVLEIALTRVFAIMMWHHLTYMVVSIALLGFGTAGSILTLRRQGLTSDFPARSLWLLATAYGFAVMIAFCLGTRIPFDSLAIWRGKWNLANLALLYVVIAIPFLFGGFVIGLAITRLAAHVNRLYFSDLLGSAAGACASVWLLARFGGSTTVIFAGGMGVAAGCLFAFAAGRRPFIASLSALVLGGIVCVAFAGGSNTLRIPSIDWPIRYAPGKVFAGLPSSVDVVRLFSATAEVEVTPSSHFFPIIGGEFGKVDRRAVIARFVGQDGTAPTMLYENAARISAFPFLDDSQSGTAYVAYRARGGSAPRVLVIGVGGGIDVMMALAHDASYVTAVEVNRAMIRLVTEEYGDYIGGLFRPKAHSFSDRLELVHEEGRSFLRSRPERYDVIQLCGVDSFTALSTGAYTLSESYLYTTEAVKDLYQRLEQGGYINFSRLIIIHPRKPRETLRLAHIAYTALAELGVEDPASQIVVFRGLDWASTLIKRGPFGREEIDALVSFAERQGFWGLVFDPLEQHDVGMRSGARFDLRGRLALELAVRERRIPGLDGPLATAEVIADLTAAFRHHLLGENRAAGLTIERLAARVPQEDHVAARTAMQSIIEELGAWGLVAEQGFARTRLDFGRLLRGSESERQEFVKQYEYDVSPSTDDKPFFFNYYRYAGLLGNAPVSEGKPSHLEPYSPDYPVGHMVLLSSLFQITVFAALLILLPLRVLSRGGIETPDTWRIFLFFGALGAGFMFIEIVLMQKMVLFLGHPTYAISVVLTSLLGFSGVGSLLTGRIAAASPRVLRILLLAILGLLLGTALAIDQLLPALLGVPFPGRVTAVVVLLAPLGLALGMAFPLGIRIVMNRCPQLLPWAWAINAFLSVFSSMFCIVLAMEIGFTKVLIIAGLTYTAGLLGMIPTSRNVSALPR